MSSWEEIEGLLYQAILGGSYRLHREPDFHEALDVLRGEVPTITDLAGRLGFPRKTVADWINKGVQPRGARREEAHQAVLEALRRHRLTLSREQRLRAGGVTIKATQRYHSRKNPSRPRTWTATDTGGIQWRGAPVSGTGWQGANNLIVDAYLAGDMRAAAEAFIEGFGSDEYREMVDPNEEAEGDPDAVFFDLESIRLE